jgi:hypothetical protein
VVALASQVMPAPAVDAVGVHGLRRFSLAICLSVNGLTVNALMAGPISGVPVSTPEARAFLA